MHKYIRIMRLNHWIKNLFVLPGSAFALLLVPEATAQGYGSLFWNLFFGTSVHLSHRFGQLRD